MVFGWQNYLYLIKKTNGVGKKNKFVIKKRLCEAFFYVFSHKTKKKMKKILQFQNNVVPLHSQFRNASLAQLVRASDC